MYNSDSEILSILKRHVFFIDLNANDFFHYATADSVQIDDFEAVIDIARKFGEPGLDAILIYSRHEKPLNRIIERWEERNNGEHYKQVKKALNYIIKNYGELYDVHCPPKKGQALPEI